MKIIRTALNSSSYEIAVGSSLDGFASALGKIQDGGTVLIVTHAKLKKVCGPRLERALKAGGFDPRFHLIAEGETAKSLRTLSGIYKAALKSRLDRGTCLIALGGGVVGDVAGFAAATYLRGIPLVQVPTTLLAMVDSSIGGKTGVDLPQAKNYIGAFYQPRMVWSDASFLKTLPDREFRNGLAEAVKYGVIMDESLFQTLEANMGALKRDPSSLQDIIARCAQIKAEVVSQDEKETKGLREILNFGHTWGHAIETFGAYKTYKHGEAISIGMCAAGWMAILLGLWKNGDLTRLENLLDHAGLPVKLSRRLKEKPLFEILLRDKKNKNGKPRFVLPEKIGKVVVEEVPAEIALKGLNYVQP